MARETAVSPKRLAWLALLLLAGCASSEKSHPPADGASAAERDAADSSVDITYMLGHNQRRFYAEAKAGGVLAQAFLDRQLLEAGKIDRDRYLSFLKKAATFIDSAQKASLERVPCRSPFTVTVRIKEATQATKGCRSADEGGLSHLVRDGEFLLNSRKN